MDKLSGLDRSFLALESPAAHMHLGATLIFSGGSLIDASGCVNLDGFRSFVESRLHKDSQSPQPTLTDHADTERLYPPSAWSALWWRITGSPARERYRAAQR